MSEVTHARTCTCPRCYTRRRKEAFDDLRARYVALMDLPISEAHEVAVWCQRMDVLIREANFYNFDFAELFAPLSHYPGGT